MKYESKNNGNRFYPITFGEKISYGINKVLTNPIGFGIAVHLLSAGVNSTNLETLVSNLIRPQTINQSATAGAMLYIIRAYDKKYHADSDLKIKLREMRAKET